MQQDVKKYEQEEWVTIYIYYFFYHERLTFLKWWKWLNVTVVVG